MPVLKTISPTAVPEAPKENPENTIPLLRTNFAFFLYGLIINLKLFHLKINNSSRVKNASMDFLY